MGWTEERNGCNRNWNVFPDTPNSYTPSYSYLSFASGISRKTTVRLFLCSIVCMYCKTLYAESDLLHPLHFPGKHVQMVSRWILSSVNSYVPYSSWPLILPEALFCHCHYWALYRNDFYLKDGEPRGVGKKKNYTSVQLRKEKEFLEYLEKRSRISSDVSEYKESAALLRYCSTLNTSFLSLQAPHPIISVTATQLIKSWLQWIHSWPRIWLI